MTQEAPAYHVLIVEDEFFIADELARALKEEGFAAVGLTADPAAALAALDETEVAFAVVDINLEGSVSFVVAAELRRRGIPFLFLTGYDDSVVPAEFSDIMLIQKPHDGPAIVAEIKRQRDNAAMASG